MKTKMIIATVTMMMLAHSVWSAEENNEEWLNKHAAIITTETIQKDGNGVVKNIRIVKDTTIYIKQTATEILKPDKNGDIVPISRTTVSTDALGGSTVIVESVIAGTKTFIQVSITTTEKIGDETITTTYARDKTGKMVVTSKTTSKSTGNATTTL